MAARAETKLKKIPHDISLHVHVTWDLGLLAYLSCITLHSDIDINYTRPTFPSVHITVTFDPSQTVPSIYVPAASFPAPRISKPL